MKIIPSGYDDERHHERERLRRFLCRILSSEHSAEKVMAGTTELAEELKTTPESDKLSGNRSDTSPSSVYSNSRYVCSSLGHASSDASQGEPSHSLNGPGLPFSMREMREGIRDAIRAECHLKRSRELELNSICHTQPEFQAVQPERDIGRMSSQIESSKNHSRNSMIGERTETHNRSLRAFVTRDPQSANGQKQSFLETYIRKMFL